MLIYCRRYFANHNPPYPHYKGNASFGANGGVYNRAGRGIPDVSANGDNIAGFFNGKFGLRAGTSASMSCLDYDTFWQAPC